MAFIITAAMSLTFPFLVAMSEDVTPNTNNDYSEESESQIEEDLGEENELDDSSDKDDFDDELDEKNETEDETEDESESESEDETEDEEDIYTELDIYKVTLPTVGTIDFVLDPLGLAGIEEGVGVPLEELDSGRIYPKSQVPATVLNESSMTVKLTVELRAVSRASNSNETVSFVQPQENLSRTRNSVFENDGLNVLLYAVPSKHGISSLSEEFDPSNTGFVITESGIELTFLLPAAEYSQADEDSYHTLVHGTGNGIQIRVGGYVNDKSDWSSFTDDSGSEPCTIGIDAVFTLTRLYDDDFETSTQKVDGVTFLRSASESGMPSSAIRLDDESIDALIPHGEVSLNPREPGESEYVGFLYNDELTGHEVIEYIDLATQQAHISVHPAKGVLFPFSFGRYDLEMLHWHCGSPENTIIYERNDNGIIIDLSNWSTSESSVYDIWIELTNGKKYILWITIDDP